MPAPATSAPSSRLWLSLFFLSGATGLVYEIIWIRMLTLVLGASIYSVAVVFAAFMLGLGAGNLAAGRLLARARSAMRLYAGIEVGIATGALIVPVLLSLATPVYQLLHGSHLGTLVAVRFALSFVIVLVPTFFIGTTFPVMVRIFVTAGRSIGSGVGALYAVNTFGAVAGTLLTSFVFLRDLGLTGTLWGAAAINLSIALTALWLSREEESSAPQSAIAEDAPADTTPLPRVGGIPAVFFVSGFTALASEVIWTRILTIYIRGSVLGLAVVLSTFLSGIALGSLLSPRWLRRPGLVVYGALFWLIGISSLIAAAAVDAVYQALFPRLISYGGVVVLSVVLMFTTTLLYGMVFPLGVQLYTVTRRQLGAAVSGLYFVNTVGGALGSLCAGFLFVPLLGLHNAIIVIAFLNFEVAAFLLLRNRRRATTVLAFSGFVALIAAALLPVTHRYINKAFASGEYVYYREGNDATVAVVEDQREDRPYHALLVDGQFVAGTQGAMEIDSKLLAHIPLLIHPHPKTALTVGFGAGGTSFSMLEHGLERVDVVEIEPAVVAANQFFLDLNFDVIHDPRLRVILEDARNYLLLTTARYDVISTDVTNIRYRSNSSLYTREYFALLQSRLAPGGVAAAWIPLSELTERDLQTLLRTFQDVFPHTTLWYSQSKMDHFAVLVGTPEPLAVDLAGLQPRFRRVLPDLSRVHAYNAYVFINMLMLDEAGVRAAAARAPVHRDLWPVLDFTAPSEIPRDVWYRNLRQVATLRTAPERYVTHASPRESALIRGYDALARTLLDGHLSILQGRTTDGERFYRQAIDMETQLKATAAGESSSPQVRPAGQVW